MLYFKFNDHIILQLSVHTGRYWDMVERLKVNQFFTTPSAIKHLMKAGDEHVSGYNLSSLRTIASSEYTSPLPCPNYKYLGNGHIKRHTS